MAANITKVQQAFLDLLDVETTLNICAEANKPISSELAYSLSFKIESARNFIEETIREAVTVLEGIKREDR